MLGPCQKISFWMFEQKWFFCHPLNPTLSPPWVRKDRDHIYPNLRHLKIYVGPLTIKFYSWKMYNLYRIILLKDHIKFVPLTAAVEKIAMWWGWGVGKQWRSWAAWPQPLAHCCLSHQYLYPSCAALGACPTTCSSLQCLCPPASVFHPLWCLPPSPYHLPAFPPAVWISSFLEAHLWKQGTCCPLFLRINGQNCGQRVFHPMKRISVMHFAQWSG